MPGKLATRFMDIRHSASVGKNMDSSRPRVREKDPFMAMSLSSFYTDEFGFELDDSSMPTPTHVPSEDIWKKFELLPTPPRSPQHENQDLLLEYEKDSLDMYKSVLQKMDDQTLELDVYIKEEKDWEDQQKADYNKLMIDDVYSSRTTKVEDFSPDEQPVRLADSLLSRVYTFDKDDESRVMMRGDCMWSGSCIRDLSPVKKEPQVWDSALSAALLSDVLPFPMFHNGATCSTSHADRMHILGSETPSDSEEEIDVVTTEDTDRKSSGLNVSAEEIRLLVTAKRASNASSPPDIEIKPQILSPGSNKCSCPSPQQQNITAVTVKTRTKQIQQQPQSVVVDSTTLHHNYSLAPVAATPSSTHLLKRTRSTPCSRQGSPVSKCLKRLISEPMQKTNITRRSGYSSRNSSDNEDCGDRRNQHNVLERKRRNDLKYSFLVLRDQVPDLAHKEKASKVLILNKAEEHILGQRKRETQLTKEYKILKERHEALKRRLATLNK